jgi:hypothetical protein
MASVKKLLNIKSLFKKKNTPDNSLLLCITLCPLSKMSANKIISSQVIKTVANRGKNITVKYAIKTETWDRSYLASNVQDDFSKAIEKADIPAGATMAILA